MDNKYDEMDLDSLIELHESNIESKQAEEVENNTPPQIENHRQISEIVKTAEPEETKVPPIESGVSGSHEVKYIRDRMNNPGKIKDRLDVFRSLKNEQFMTKEGRDCLDTEEKTLINLINQTANKGTFLLRLGQILAFFFGLPITIGGILMIVGTGFNLFSIIIALIGLALLGQIGELGDKIKDIKEAINAQKGVGKVKIVNNHITFLQ